MDTVIPAPKIKQYNPLYKINVIAQVFIFIFSIAIFNTACSSKDSSKNIYGKYMIYSDDPQVRQFTEGQDTYIQLNEDQTIVYNSTINYKPKFNYKGKFSLDKNSNTLSISWQEGNFPDTLKIETRENDYVIRVGNTIYKKEKSRG